MWALYLSFYIVLVPQASSMEEQLNPDINMPIVELQADRAN
jgi:hypothetical protein